MSWLRNMAIAVDQMANAVLAGSPDETLSSRAWRARHRKYWGWTHRAINALFWWQANHCLGAYEAEVARRQLPANFGEA